MHLPMPCVERLITISRHLEELEKKATPVISSIELEKALGISAVSIRKDLSFLEYTGAGRSGYSVMHLKSFIRKALGLETRRKSCLVGLGNMGMSILRFEEATGGPLGIVAGFDSSINRLETMQTSIPLFPAHEIAETVRRLGLELAVVAVPPEAAQKTADRLVEGGIKGIVNLTPVILKHEEEVIVRDFSIAEELRILSALMTQKEKEKTT